MGKEPSSRVGKKGKEGMKYLEELEEKVTLIVAANKELKNKIDMLNTKIIQLQDDYALCKKELEKQSHVAESLVKEKEAVQAAVETIIGNIETFEKSL